MKIKICGFCGAGHMEKLCPNCFPVTAPVFPAGLAKAMTEGLPADKPLPANATNQK